MRLHRLVTGAVRAKAGERGVRRYLVDDWREEALPVNAFLVEHPSGPVLFDAGQTARAVDDRWFPRWHPFFRLSRFELRQEEEIVPQLRALGIAPAAVQTVVLSHLHTDHVGCIGDFPHARVLVHRLEWERATGLGGHLRGYLPQRWPAGLEPTLIDLDGPAVGPFRSSYDVVGDGRLLVVPTPGHTAGHVGLLVRDDDSSWLLAGDLAHTAGEVQQVAPDIADWCAREQVGILTAHDAAAVGRLSTDG